MSRMLQTEVMSKLAATVTATATAIATAMARFLRHQALKCRMSLATVVAVDLTTDSGTAGLFAVS